MAYAEKIGKNFIQLPITKASVQQGKLIATFLDIVGKKNVNKVSSVIEELKPYTYKDLEKRFSNKPDKLKEFKTKMKDEKRKRKFFDSEYCRLGDFCEDFNLISQQNQDIMLTFFGRKLLEQMKRNSSKDIFDDRNLDFLARVFIFVDKVKKWKIIDTLAENENGLTTRELAELLLSKNVGIDKKGLERRLKPHLIKKYRKEWKEKLKKSGTPDWFWLQSRYSKEIKQKILDEEERILGNLLAFFKRVGLVNKANDRWVLDRNKIHYLMTQQFWNTSKDIKENEFLNALESAYFELYNKNGKNPHIPIPLIRNLVCLKLSIPWETFDMLLKNTPLKTKNFSIFYSQGRFSRKWGILIKSTPYYYMSLRRNLR